MKDWTVTTTCGGRYPAADPLFFNDNSKVIIATALAVKIYQLSTKQMVNKISLDCTDVIQMFLSANEEHVFCVRHNGIIDQISLLDSAITKIDCGGQSKINKLISQISEDSLYAIAINANGNFEIGKLNISTNQFESQFESLAHYDTGFTAVAPSARYVAFASSKSNKLQIYDLKTKLNFERFGANRSPASCIAVSDNGVIAMGTTSGVIDLIYEDATSTRALKWHLEPVSALSFTFKDTYLLSGGAERVLVFWQLTTNEQQFLPRMPDDISSIVMNNNGSLYGITVGRSQLIVLSATNLVSRLHVSGTKTVFNNLPPDSVANRRRRKRNNLDLWADLDYTTPLAVQPGTRNVHLKAGRSQTQVYNLLRDEQEAVINLAPVPDVGKVRKELEILDPEVDLLKFTPNGKFIVTTESSVTPPGLLSSEESEVNLKFWSFDTNSNTWELATRVVSPHGKGVPIKDICFINDGTVTAGSDGSIRLWRITDLNKNNQGVFSLRRSLKVFNNTLDSSVSVCSSQDGSVLALAHDSTILIIDAKTFSVRAQLPNVVSAPIRSVSIAGSSIVVLAQSRLVSYDLVTMKETWSIALKSPENGMRLLAVDQLRSVIAFAVNFWDQNRVKSLVLQFNTTSPIPNDCFLHSCAISSVSHIPGSSSFCFIDVRGVLSVVSGSVDKSLTTGGVTNSRSLVSFQSTNAGNMENVDEMDLDRPAYNLDVNSVSEIFESGGSIEQLFDRVAQLLF